MRKSLAGLLAATLSLPVLTMAVPTVSYLGSIPIGGFGTAPTGVAVYNGAVFVNAFTQNKVLKISTPFEYAAPTVTFHVDLSSTFTWGSSRGLQGLSVDPANGNLIVAGDTGSLGAVAIVDQAGTIVSSGTFATRTNTATKFGAAGNLLLSGTNSTLYNVNSSLVEANNVAGTSFYRGSVVVGDTIYAIHNNNTATDSITKLTGGTAGSLAGYTASEWFATSGKTTNAYQGLASYFDAGSSTTYIVVPDPKAATPSVKFVNTNTGVADVTFADANLADINGVATATISGGDYVFLTAPSGGSFGTRVVVLGINGATAVNDWTVYN